MTLFSQLAAIAQKYHQQEMCAGCRYDQPRDDDTNGCTHPQYGTKEFGDMTTSECKDDALLAARSNDI